MRCRICDSTSLAPVIDLGLQPWGNNFLAKDEIGNEPRYPLRVVYCEHCHTAQLDYTVKKEIMFGDHTYLSGMTKSLANHFDNIAKEVDARFFSGQNIKSVLDIGSNDGTQLKCFQKLGYDALGVESSVRTAKIANEQGVSTLNCFFNEETAKEIGKKFDVINASGIFFHLEELHSVCEGIKTSLAENGIFIVQFLYMKDIMRNNAFDQIYHEHLLYYTLETLDKLLKKHGLALFDARHADIHGGSIIGFITHAERKLPKSQNLLKLLEAERISGCNELSAYESFAKRIKAMKKENLDWLLSEKNRGKRIFGFGAPVKGNTLLNYFGLGTDVIECLVEKNPLRKNLFSPGMHIPVLLENELRELPDIYYVLAWNFKHEILRNNQKLLDAGIAFYFPVDPDKK